MMPYKSYFRGKRRIYGGRYKSLINVLQRHTNQARYLYKPLYNFNYLMLAFLTGKRVVSTGVAFTKTASFVDQKICFKLADANYVNPFLFFDFLCDAVLTNVYSVISIEHIGGAFTILTKELSFLGIRDVSQKQNFLFYKMRKCVLTTEAQLLN